MQIVLSISIQYSCHVQHAVTAVALSVMARKRSNTGVGNGLGTRLVLSLTTRQNRNWGTLRVVESENDLEKKI